ncbi:hypothetical protein GNI_130790 [Gregarina niphandrodes]|uniref:Uncharacterized protein n=1 Tax=Gregarina niphandrodes TaxID=110365 RepID=A0A023B1F5_GRENI|nr:hypothetical protein GNI_130790 [Gregarina niphandrodes]EZG47653.1 hypothetical protein GNI_130790 [Gregarina niphandrodes]|eukprot:XP_011132155.1 hypothetical protein GNI_130790 [Gregarina niphandrodes]
MSTFQSPYFQQQLAIAVQAERVLAVRDKLVKRSREAEECREYISALTQPSHPVRVTRTGYVYKRLSDPAAVNHSAAFEILSAPTALELNQKERAALVREIEALKKQQKDELRKLVDLKPDFNANPELRFLLNQREDDESSDDA